MLPARFRQQLQGLLRLLIPFLLTLFLFGAQVGSYDGDWWQKSTAAEQEGFILGFGDCYADPDGVHIRVVADEGDVRIAVSTYYQSHASERHRPTAKVLKDLWNGHVMVRAAQPARPGDGWRERHGFLDAAWWKGSNPAEKLGFIEGYVTCHNAEERREAALKHLPSWYVAQVSDWYDQPADEDVMAQRRATKIRDVLTRLPASGNIGTR